MVDEEGKKEEEKFEFDSAGEAIGYISLEQAVVLAMRTADDEPGNYGRRYRDVRMVFEAVQQEEGEDFYTITLSFRPEGAFVGTVGQEQFFIAKEGTIARRQVLSLPLLEGQRRFPVVPVVIAVVLVAIAGGVGVVFAGGGLGGGGDDGTAVPLAAAVPTPTPMLTVTPTPTPTQPLVAPTRRPTATPTTIPVSATLPSATPTVMPTPVPTRRPTPYSLSVQLGEAVETYEVTLEAGTTLGLMVEVLDSAGNRVTGPLIAWKSAPDVGTVDENGVFTAATTAGSYPSGIQVNVVRGTDRGSAKLDVIIVPGSLATIGVEPSPTVMREGETIQLTATGFDTYGNAIGGLTFLWDSEGGLVIDQTGKVTAGDRGGSYEITARASYRDIQQTGFATVGIPPLWVPVGNMAVERAGLTAALLANGKVLVVGGGRIAELYDPLIRKFSLTGTPFCGHGGWPTATLLPDGGVLVTGGDTEPRCVEIYDPETAVFSRVGDLNADHWWHTATLLRDGRVVIAGGNKRQDDASVSQAVAEIYDPVTQSFSLTGSLKLDRQEHTAILLPSGKVLVTGGIRLFPSDELECIGSPELYDPTTGTFTPIGIGGISDTCWTKATLLNNGNVLVTSERRQAHLFDPVTETFRPTGIMTERRKWHAATLLASGEVVITGGTPNLQPITALATAEIYDPITETFKAIDAMGDARFQHTAVLLADVSVLVPGGRMSGGELNSAELWIPSGATDLVSWWPGDGNTYDVVGGNHGSLANGASFGDGIIGQAFSFDGTGTVDLGKLGAAPAQGTIELWINSSVVDGPRSAFTTNLAGNENAVSFEEQLEGGFIAVVGISSPQNSHYTFTSTFTANVWHHVAFVWINGGSEIKGYFDGVESFSTPTNPFFPSSFPDAKIGIGVATSPERYWKGLVDDVRIYNLALTVDEIKSIYEAGS